MSIILKLLAFILIALAFICALLCFIYIIQIELYEIFEAELIGVDRWTLGNIFKTKSMPRGYTTYLIAKGLNMDYEKVRKLCK